MTLLALTVASNGFAATAKKRVLFKNQLDKDAIIIVFDGNNRILAPFDALNRMIDPRTGEALNASVGRELEIEEVVSSRKYKNPFTNEYLPARRYVLDIEVADNKSFPKDQRSRRLSEDSPNTLEKINNKIAATPADKVATFTIKKSAAGKLQVDIE
jgi:hypothetical protein